MSEGADQDVVSYRISSVEVQQSYKRRPVLFQRTWQAIWRLMVPLVLNASNWGLFVGFLEAPWSPVGSESNQSTQPASPKKMVKWGFRGVYVGMLLVMILCWGSMFHPWFWWFFRWSFGGHFDAKVMCQCLVQMRVGFVLPFFHPACPAPFADDYGEPLELWGDYIITFGETC